MNQNQTGVVNIRGKEYKTVALRVQEFHEWNTEHDRRYAIRTEILARDNIQVCVKASIVDTHKDENCCVMATGHSEEFRASGNINRTSALENCETSAIGRALAAFGFGGSEFASANEVQTAIAQQQSKAPPAKVAAVRALLNSGKVKEHHLEQAFGHCIVENLLEVEADRIINGVKAQTEQENEDA